MINMELTGKAIADARKRAGLTQERLAELIGVTVQAVSKWENGKNLPDIENLLQIAEHTNTPYGMLLGVQEQNDDLGKICFRDRLFQEENMFTRMRTVSLAENMPQTYKALTYMRERHMGQYRKKRRFSNELVQYINHPLVMACQAHALGVRDDALLAAILLHDVVEDTGVSLEELPFPDEVRELVGLVTFTIPEGMTKAQAKDAYFAAIRQNGKACIIKIIDRCNNVSDMAGAFDRKKLLQYINETEEYVLPLMRVLKNEYPEYSDLAFLVKYQIISLIESVKQLIA